MNPQEHNTNPYQPAPQPGSAPNGLPQPGVQPPDQPQPGVFVGGPGIMGGQAPQTPAFQPGPPQPHPAYANDHLAHPAPQQPQPFAQPAPQPHTPYAQPHQPYHGSPAPQAPMPQPHNPHGQWQQPAHGSSYPTRGGQNTKLIVIIAAAVFVLLLGVGAFFILKGDNPVSNLTNSITGGGDDVVDRSDGTLDLSNLIDSGETIKNQDIKAKLNQQVNLSDGSSYMVTSVERNWTHPEIKVANGKELIKITVVVGNKSKEGGLYFSDNFFRLKNSVGGLQDSEYVTEEEVPDMLVGGEVAPGKQKKGTIIYEVDKDEQLGGLVTEDKYTKIGSDEEITITSLVAF